MYKYGHIGLALLVATPLTGAIAVLGPVEWAFLATVLAVGVCRVPDWDQRFPLSLVVSHRGITHTLLAATVVSIVGGSGIFLLTQSITQGTVAEGTFLFGTSPPVRFGIATTALLAGYLSHLLGDAITVSGLKPFRPFSSQTVRLARIRARSKIWNAVFLLAGITAQVVLVAALIQLG